MKGFLNSIRSRAGIRPKQKQRVTGQANQPLTGTAQRQKKKALAGLKARTTGSSLPTLGGRVGGPQNPRGAYIGKYTSPRGKAAIGLRKKKAASDLAGQQRRPKRKPRPGGKSWPVLPPNKPRSGPVLPPNRPKLRPRPRPIKRKTIK